MAETEVILLRRFAASRDAAAFAEITRRHAGLVYGAAWRVLADMDRAADVAQETFLQLTKDAGTITGSLPGWLHRVATHKAIDVRRREASRKHREIQYVEGQEREARDWKDISPYVDEGLRDLDPELREILIAHFLNGQTTRGIAEVQGVSQATVSRRIEAGVNQLRSILRKRGIIVAVGALGVLLNENAAQGAPAVLMTELGKMAMVGGHAAAVSAGAGQSISSLFSTVTNTVVATVKANAVAFAALAAIGAGSVLTYEAISSSAKKGGEAAPVSAPAPITRPQGRGGMMIGRTPPPNQQPATQQPPNQPTAAVARPDAEVENEQTVVSTSDSGALPPAGRGFRGMGMGDYGMEAGGMRPDYRAGSTDPNQMPPDYPYNYGAQVQKLRPDSNDSNDSNSTKP